MHLCIVCVQFDGAKVRGGGGVVRLVSLNIAYHIETRKDKTTGVTNCIASYF